MHPLIAVVSLLQLRVLLHRLPQRDTELVRYHLRDGVRKTVREVHCSSDVADDAAGEHCAERDDLDDVVLPVEFRDVIDDFLPPLGLEVHVDIGHRDALRVEEPLEEEIIPDRVELCDPRAERND